MKGHLHDQPRSILVPPNKLMPAHALNRSGWRTERRSAPTERRRITRRRSEGGRDEMGSHLGPRNKPTPSAIEAEIGPERLPLFAELSDLASGMQTEQLDW
jgi:hypothetical protein